jgi:hypothetical protein
MTTHAWSRAGRAGFGLAVVIALVAHGSVLATAENGTGTNSNSPQPGAERHELVPDPVVYAAAKAAANRAARHELPVAPSSATRLLPRIIASFEGIDNAIHTPPDETSAIGPDRFIEFVNTELGIFDRNGTLLANVSAEELTGASPGDFTSDPQILWDPSSLRFYYTIYENRNHTGVLDPGIAWGFSAGVSPAAAADFCKYFARFNYGGTFPDGVFPDFPQLGTTHDYLLIGANRFTFGESFVGADLAWISKPPSGGASPDPSRFSTGIFEQLKNADGSAAFTPIPTRQVDPSPTGWVLSALFPGGDYLNVYTVRPDPSTGFPLLSRAARLDVAAYSVPADAPQAGTTASGQPAPLLDTLSGKLTQAYGAIDPRVRHMAIWTAQAVSGGAGSEVRWYEIDPVRLRLDQAGVVSDPALHTFFFSGTLAPDRAINGRRGRFGSNMVLGFDQSSTTIDVQIAMVSKVGAKVQSAPVVVQTSPSPNVDANCFGARGACRWGDYSSASPDPTPGKSRIGRVWLTNEWNVASTDDNDIDWRTWNWVAAPRHQ